MPRGFQHNNRCGRGYCPASIRIAWGEGHWRLPQAAQSIGKGVTSLLRGAELLDLPKRDRQRTPKAISNATFKRLWADENKPLAQIAEDNGISVDTLQYRRRTFSLGKRKCGPKVKWQACRWFNEMWEFGVATAAIARHMGCSQSKVSIIARDRGLKLRHGFRGRAKTMAQFFEHGVIVQVRAKDKEKEAA